VRERGGGVTTQDEEQRRLHLLARRCAQALAKPDKRQLRFNEIVRVARAFYAEPSLGVEELVAACDTVDPRYVPRRPMWAELDENYRWMLGGVAV